MSDIMTPPKAGAGMDMDDLDGFLRQSLIWDNHACMPLRPEDESFLPELERVRQSNVDVISLNIGFGPQTLEDHVRMMASFRRWIMQRPDEYLLVENVADIDRAKASNRLGIVFDLEGMVPFDQGDHGLVQLFYDLGVRWALFAYNRNNQAGGGCMDEDCGLTGYGRQILAEMGRVGMVVCCSHTGHQTVRDILDAAQGPVIFSHSNASAIHTHRRNIPDDLIRACADTGGVVGVNGIGLFLGDGDDLSAAMVKHIDHMVGLVGPDHVGLGIDFVFDQQEFEDYLRTMKDTFPDDQSLNRAIHMAPPEAVRDIAIGLFDLGYAKADVGKILGQNWRRVAEQVWR